MGDPAVASIPVAECGEGLVLATEDFVLSALKDGHDPYRSRRCRRGSPQPVVALDLPLWALR